MLKAADGTAKNSMGRRTVEYTDGTKRNRPIWNHVPGLHVNYELGPYADRLSIEVDSVAQEREKSEQKAEEAAPKL